MYYYYYYYFNADPANSQASTQTVKSKRENNGLQRTSWQRRFFEKKPRFPYEVPQTAAETNTASP